MSEFPYPVRVTGLDLWPGGMHLLRVETPSGTQHTLWLPDPDPELDARTAPAPRS